MGYMVDRLKEDLVETSQFGRTPSKKVESYDELDPENGVTRPTAEKLKELEIGL